MSAAATIPAYLAREAAPHAHRVALRGPVDGEVREITYRELFHIVERFGRGLGRLGVRPGDRVLFLADNEPRWMLADLGILWAGGVGVPRSADTTAAEAEWLLSHSGAVAAVVGRPALRELLPGGGAGLRAVVALQGEAEGVVPFRRVLERGEGDGPPPEPAAGGLATVVYTSGTTGRPKGVMLTHENILHNVRVLPAVCGVDPGDRFLSILPSWHMFERTVEYTVLATGAVLVYSSLRTLKRDLREERPQFLVAVPRLFEGLQKAFQTQVASRGLFGRALAGFLLSRLTAHTLHRHRLRGLVEETPPRRGFLRKVLSRAAVAGNAPFAFAGRKLLGRRLREAVGGKLRYGISGGGLLPLYLDVFLAALGIEVLVGYGLTETSPVLTVRDRAENCLGTIGRALPETELRVCDEEGNPLPPRHSGELQVRGPQVMAGYYREPEATRAVLSEDGWFRTGDLCLLTERGDVVFRGRLKDTIVLAGGENVEPAPIEARILMSPFIRQALVVGQDRKALAALLVPDPDLAPPEAEKRGVELEDLFRAEVRRLVTPEAGFKAREMISRVLVLDREFTIEDGTLTLTQKVRRNVVLDRYRDKIEDLYR